MAQQCPACNGKGWTEDVSSPAHVSIETQCVGTTLFIRNNALWGRTTVRAKLADGEFLADQHYEVKLAEFGVRDAKGDVLLGPDRNEDKEGLPCAKSDFLLL